MATVGETARVQRDHADMSSSCWSDMWEGVNHQQTAPVELGCTLTGLNFVEPTLAAHVGDTGCGVSDSPPTNCFTGLGPVVKRP